MILAVISLSLLAWRVWRLRNGEHPENTESFFVWLRVCTVGVYAALACMAIDMAIRFRRVFVLRSRLKRGRCVACGYDLTGNTSGVCPECGAPVPAEAGA